MEITQKMNKNRLRKLLLRIIRSWQLYILIAPATLYYAIFHFQPIYGVQIAFRNYKAKLGITGSPWVGLAHFERFIEGPNFLRLLENTLSISLTNLIFGFPLPILLALTLNELRQPRYKRLVQTVSYAPHFISTVVMVSIIQIFLDYETGIINHLISLFGVGPFNFLAKGNWFHAIYVISGIWKNMGWKSIVFLSALSSIDPSHTEAAMVDGATRLQRIWHVNLPTILPTVVIMFILSAGDVMSVGYEKAYLLQNSLNLEYSEIISTYVYKVGLINTQFSFSAAVGLFNSICNVILLLSVNWISKKVSEVGLF